MIFAYHFAYEKLWGLFGRVLNVFCNIVSSDNIPNHFCLSVLIMKKYEVYLEEFYMHPIERYKIRIRFICLP